MGRDQERPYAGVALWGFPGAPGRAERLRTPKGHHRPPSSLPAAGKVIAGRWEGHHRPPSSLPAAGTISHIEQAHSRPLRRSLPAAEHPIFDRRTTKMGFWSDLGRPLVQPCTFKNPYFYRVGPTCPIWSTFWPPTSCARVRTRVCARMRV